MLYLPGFKAGSYHAALVDVHRRGDQPVHHIQSPLLSREVHRRHTLKRESHWQNSVQESVNTLYTLVFLVQCHLVLY